MTKEKKISINAFDAAVGEYDEDSVVEWSGLEIRVKHAVPYMTMAKACAIAADACFDKDGNYGPEAKDFAVRLLVLSMYTNLNIPTSLEKRYFMACLSGVYEAVVPEINPYQIAQILESVDERIHVRTQAAVDAVIRQANSVASAVQDISEKLEQQFGSFFGDVDPGVMSAAIRKIAEDGVDEEKIVHAYMENTREVPEHHDE